ncbi:MAG: NADH:ubiquinone reductase (Na(+)-transporting) subunit C [Gammaproteobacteria bacterium]|nr:NADH:ubiquinone reductase (Na(+)-transporting) subunit C [Gammaproteobacteria bacterium]
MRDRDGIANTLIVSVSLSLIASVLVAGTAIALKPKQEQNEERYRQQIILDVAGLYEPGADIGALFDGIETRRVNLASGDYASDTDAEGAVEVYVVRENGVISQVILPVYGPGLWSTMRGFLALRPDGNTIQGLRFYEHAETPGLGDQIDKPAWRAQWAGKRVYAADGDSRIEVIKGFVDANSPDAIHQVDGISGATLTGRGVTDLIRYWTGPQGFGPYLEKFRMEAGSDD